MRMSPGNLPNQEIDGARTQPSPTPWTRPRIRSIQSKLAWSPPKLILRFHGPQILMKGERASRRRFDLALSYWESRQIIAIPRASAILPPRYLRQFPMPEALDKVIIHHAHGLHERVTDLTANKLEALLLQILAHGVRRRGLGRNFLD